MSHPCQAEPLPLRVCQICRGRLAVSVPEYVMRCESCGALTSTLQPDIASGALSARIDESLRGNALKRLRRRNFALILDRLLALGVPVGAKVLDVGCAHGWFLEQAAERGLEVLGIEPDAAMIAAATHRLPVIKGFFPESLPAGARFDVITFNDVFEHLPDIGNALDACMARLAPRGMVVINAPSRNGIFFRVAVALHQMGIAGPLDRLWQKGFPSPHVHYLAPPDFPRLAAAHGMRVRDRFSLRSVDASGLWTRLRYDASSSLSRSAMIWVAVMSAMPLLRIAPADIEVSILGVADRAAR